MPYYKRQPKAEAEFAWYCGEDSEYFVKLFTELPLYIHQQSKVIMVLSDDCDIAQINSIAQKNNFLMVLGKKYFRFWETDYVYEITPV